MYCISSRSSQSDAQSLIQHLVFIYLPSLSYYFLSTSTIIKSAITSHKRLILETQELGLFIHFMDETWQHFHHLREWDSISLNHLPFKRFIPKTPLPPNSIYHSIKSAIKLNVSPSIHSIPIPILIHTSHNSLKRKEGLLFLTQREGYYVASTTIISTDK